MSATRKTALLALVLLATTCVSAQVPQVHISHPGYMLLQIDNSGLVPGGEYYNLVSLEPAPAGLGTGPYLGLWTSNPATLIHQIVLPVGTGPFHFIASGSTEAWGPFFVPGAIYLEVICVEITGGTIGSVSGVASTFYVPPCWMPPLSSVPGWGCGV